jgi:la-related protein 1
VPAFWIKEKDSPVELTSSGIVHVSYNNFRKRALEKHDSIAADGGEHAMDVLYRFWSHFLVNNFNAKMYDEFKNLALDDHGKSGVATGFNSLVQFYDSMLLNSTVVPDEVAYDLVGLVETEPVSSGRPLFHKLRSAWRNGAFNLDSRTKIDQIISKDLKAELEG